MPKHLLIVESPTKARTLSQFLGSEYVVKSSFGHIRDLPKSKLGVDVAHSFEPTYVIPPKARKIITELKKAVAKANETILSTDEDREGEAIAWHLAEALGLDPEHTKRIVFHEITKRAIEDALERPRTIDMKLVDAQQGRRVLDRLVGYELSPFLWRKVARGLSAGRVQSVAVRVIVDREREIENFKPEEYWTIAALLKPKKDDAFEALLHVKDGEVIPKLGIKTEKGAASIQRDLEGAEYRVAAIEKKEARRYPAPPFTTSTLVQEASRRFRYSSKFTMRLAQELYEKGFITYHRSDSVSLSNLFLGDAKTFITKEFGGHYHQFRTYKTKSQSAQEAHEAIRPTEVARKQIGFRAEEGAEATDDARHTPGAQSDDRLKKLYDLIWRRAVASQMKEALFEATTVDIAAKTYVFRATGSVMKFEGFLKVWPSKTEEVLLPALKENDPLTLLELLPKQHFTEPPPRYSEATLVKTLEAHGIGRPSTYAPTISTIQERRYVEKEQRYFKPTDLGKTVTDLMIEHFPNIVDVQFTAKMEEDLDRIAEGKTEWVPVIRSFYTPFKETLMKKYEEVSKRDVTTEATDEVCPECGKPLIVRLGRFGKFYGCSGFPDCTYKRSAAVGSGNNGGDKNAPAAPEKTDEPCPNCGKPLVIRAGRFGKFYGCSTYPKCAYTRNIVVSLGIPCPQCGQGELVERRTKKGRKPFWGCSKYPQCAYATWTKPASPPSSAT